MMKNHLLSLSRSLFKAINLFDSLLAQAFVMITELKEIKELLRVQNEQSEGLLLLTAEEVATKLKVNFRTLTAWSQAGKLTTVKIGSKTYYLASEVL